MAIAAAILTSYDYRAAFYEKIFLNFKLMEWSAVHKKLLHEVIHISTNSITIIATLFTLIGKKKKKFLQASGMFILSLYPKDNWTMNVTLSYLWCRCNNFNLFYMYIPASWLMFVSLQTHIRET